jgi:hypothetical protein
MPFPLPPHPFITPVEYRKLQSKEKLKTKNILRVYAYTVLAIRKQNMTTFCGNGKGGIAG